VANPTIWLTPQQAAEYAKCDPVTLRRAVQRGLLIAYRINGGRRVRYRAEDLDQWLYAYPVAVAS
jgi:excisionase family DNA binding protein